MVGVVDRCFYSTLITMETSGLRIEKEKAAESHISVSHPQNLVQIHEEILTGVTPPFVKNCTLVRREIDKE
jgi:hypothetical protein